MTGTRATVGPGVVLLGILALAVNLRAALAGYPPLLETVRVDLGLSAGVAGLVQAGAVLMMAAGSFAGPALARHGGRERALGVAVGLVAAGFLTQLLTRLLYDVEPLDPWTFAITAVALLLVATVASYVPARRGMRMAPVEALRIS